MTDRFNIRRFWAMLRHDYDHNVPSAWIGMPLAAFAAILFGEIGFMMSGYSINPGSFADTFYVVLASFFILSMVLMATFMFDKMSGRYGQISYLTLPATNLEKFLVNLLETVVSTIVFFIIGMVLADAARIGLCMTLFNKPLFQTMLLPQIFVEKVVPLGVIALWLQSVTMIGSALWRRKVLVKSLALLFVVVAAAILVNGICNPSLTTTNIILAPLTLANYVLTYKIFVKTQLK